MPSFLAAPALPRIPLIPESILKTHGVSCIIDTRFRAATRLLAALWLHDNQIATGHHIRRDNDGDIATPMESLLSPEAARAGRNFISPEVHRYVRESLILQEEGACYDNERLFRNSISSMPMCFNVFAPLAMDLGLATATFRILLPQFVKRVEGIRFETSPCRDRADPRFLMDGTAWDLALEVVTPDGEQATIFVECKLTESMDGPAARHRERYDVASRQVGLFVDPDAASLRSLALEQLWREHVLAQIAVNERVTSRALFVAIGPRLNRRVQAAFRVYANELITDSDLDDDRVRFQAITLETVIDTIRQAGAVDLAQTLWARYCDYERVFNLCMAEYAEDASNAPDATPSGNDSGDRKRRRKMESAHVG